ASSAKTGRTGAERGLQADGSMVEPEKAVKPATAPAPSPPTPAPTPTPAAAKASPPGGNAVTALAHEGGARPPTGVIDLQGHSMFEPSPELAEYIRQQGHRGAAIPVKFGNLSKAGGEILVAGTGKTFYTVGAQGIPIDHEFVKEPLAKIQ